MDIDVSPQPGFGGGKGRITWSCTIPKCLEEFLKLGKCQFHSLTGNLSSVSDRSRARSWGDRCKFAHSVEEREVWNMRKLKSIDTQSKPWHDTFRQGEPVYYMILSCMLAAMDGFTSAPL